MDAGKLIYGKVREIYRSGAPITVRSDPLPKHVWVHIVIEIYMRDL